MQEQVRRLDTQLRRQRCFSASTFTTALSNEQPGSFLLGDSQGLGIVGEGDCGDALHISITSERCPAPTPTTAVAGPATVGLASSCSLQLFQKLLMVKRMPTWFNSAGCHLCLTTTCGSLELHMLKSSHRNACSYVFRWTFLNYCALLSSLWESVRRK